MDKLLKLLERDGRISAEKLAIMLDTSPEEVLKMIKQYENDRIIVGFSAIVNWDKVGSDRVTAIIELKVSPSKGQGFDKIAQTIYRFPEVRDVSLMSGGYDLAVTVEGGNMKEVALFVAERLSVLESVLATATHFVLKKYKCNGIMLDDADVDKRTQIL